MKVLILGYELPPIGGGTGQALLHLIEEWKTLPDVEIEVWTSAPPKGTSRTLPEGVRVREFWCGKKGLHFWRGIEQFLLLWRIWRETLGDEWNADVVLVWGGWPLGLLLLGRLGGFPSVAALRGSDVPGFNPRTSGWIWRVLARAVWNRASRLTANSPALAHLAMHTASGSEIEVIPNGVNRVVPPRSDASSSSEVQWPEDRPIRILAVNRLVRRKRVDWLIQAAVILPPEWRERIEIRIVGDGPEMVRLKTAAKELALEKQIRFLGEVPTCKMSDLYAEADLFVLASSAEGLSNALLEAMAAGLPCFHATSTGLEDVDEAIVTFRSHQSLSSKMLSLFEDPAWARRLGEEAARTAQKYNWRRAAERYDALLRQIQINSD